MGRIIFIVSAVASVIVALWVAYNLFNLVGLLILIGIFISIAKLLSGG